MLAALAAFFWLVMLVDLRVCQLGQPACGDRLIKDKGRPRPAPLYRFGWVLVYHSLVANREGARVQKGWVGRAVNSRSIEKAPNSSLNGHAIPESFPSQERRPDILGPAL